MSRRLSITRISLLAMALLCIALAGATASVKVGSLFSSNMVLQRNKPVPVYGTASPGESVTVKFGSQQVSTVADAQGNWKVSLPSMSANKTGQNLTITGTNTITISNVVVGDVWVCSGQSNMAMGLYGCNRQSDIDSANYSGLRQFSVPLVTSDVPQKDVQANWTVCSPSTAPNFSAVAFYFGRKIYLDQSSNIPIGLLVTTVGGTCIDPWLAPEGVTDIPAIQPLFSQNILPWGPFALFNGMVFPLAPYAVKGGIWYQGESMETTNQTNDSYYLKEKALIQGWQRLWGGDDFPFYIVQISNFWTLPTGFTPELPGRTWADIRIQQNNVLGLPHTGMAVTIDVGETDDIHPKDKLDVGERLALWALKNDYGRNIPTPSGPILRDAVVSSNKIICSFDYVGNGLMVGSKTPYQPAQEVPGGTLQRFSIAGTNGTWYSATATIVGNTVEVSSTNVQEPTKVAYACWQNPLGANLYNKVIIDGVANGLPASPFYVDDATAAGHFAVTATAGSGGTISPAGSTTYLKRMTALYTITPNSGYHIKDVKVDGVSVGAVKHYTFDPIYANHTIDATFASSAQSYTITASSSSFGTISSAGVSTIAQGGAKTYTIAPNAGCQIVSVLVDGYNVGKRNSFTFSDVRTNHTIAANFEIIPSTISATAGYGGTISPSGPTLVAYGANQTFTITPLQGYVVSGVKVDGVEVGGVTSYTFTNVVANHTISASFAGGGGAGSVPQQSQIFFSVMADSLPANGNISSWPTYIPSGSSLSKQGDPTVEIVDGKKWEKNVYADNDGFTVGNYTSPIACNGATIVTAVKPVRNPISVTPWTSIVDVFYWNLVLGVHNDTGEICAWRNGISYATGAIIPDGQTTILTMIVQPSGTFKIYANGTQVFSTTDASAYMQMVPGAESYMKYVTLGRNFPDTWTTFNGNIGDTFLYKVALTDVERQQLESHVAYKLTGGGGTTLYAINASAGTGGTITPGGSVGVSSGSNQTFTIAASSGYTVADVKVDNASVGAVTSYTFTNVTANHTISATFNALPVTVTGKVTDVTTGAAIPGATVYFSASPNPSGNPTYTVTTDASGNYSQVLPVGTWYGAASKTAYDMSADKTFAVTAGSASTLNFALSLTPLPGTEVFYKFDETTGTTASEASGSGKIGTLTNGPVWSAGKSINCLNFDGTNDYVSVPNLGDYSSMTISAWVNIDSLGTDATGSAILACDGSDAGDIQFLILKASGKMRFSLVGNTAVDSDSNYAFTSADFGKWRHVAVVYDSVAKTVKFYINGGLNATRTLTTTRLATLSNGVRVGGWSGSRYFDGKIDEFHIYGRALSASEIAAIVNSSPAIKISDAKKLANGELVTLKDKVVTYAPRTAAGTRATNYFYIEETDRSAGLLVQGISSVKDDLNVDAPVTVSGIMKTITYTGQRYLELSSLPGIGAAGVATPLGMVTKSILTDSSAVGLLVRVIGKVSSLSVDEGWFNITDGYGVDTLVICETGIPLSGFVVGDTVAVTGAVGKDAVFTADPVGIVYLRSVVKL